MRSKDTKNPRKEPNLSGVFFNDIQIEIRILVVAFG